MIKERCICNEDEIKRSNNAMTLVLVKANLRSAKCQRLKSFSYQKQSTFTKMKIKFGFCSFFQ